MYKSNEMVTKFNCTCGNQDPKKVKEYDGCLGYEALICLDCGKYYDHTGEHEPDEFSMSFIVPT
jgi:hypothetical protein